MQVRDLRPFSLHQVRVGGRSRVHAKHFPSPRPGSVAPSTRSGVGGSLYQTQLLPQAGTLSSGTGAIYMKRKFNEELSGNEVYLTARIIMICARSQDQILALDLENVLHLLESVLQLLTLWLAVSITRGSVAFCPCTRSGFRGPG